MVKVTAGLPLLNSNKYINIGLWKGISLWLNSDLAETVTGFTKAAIKILIRHLNFYEKSDWIHTRYSAGVG